MNVLTTFPSKSFGWVLETSWQAAVVAALVLLTQLIFRRKLSPAWRYGLWCLVLVRLAMPVSPRSAISVFNLTKVKPRHEAKAPTAARVDLPKARVEAESAAEVPKTIEVPFPMVERPTTRDSDVIAPATEAPRARLRPAKSMNSMGLASLIWLGGAVILGARMVLSDLRFRWRLRGGGRVSDLETLELLKDCARVLRIKSSIVLIETAEVSSPAVYGLWRKRLLVPEGLLEDFSRAELGHVFLHELAHIKRRDLEVNWVASVLQVLHWFNPVIWLAFVRLRAERELATDALALACAGEPENIGYGETILKVVERIVSPGMKPGLVGIAESKARIKERVVAIASHGGTRPWRWAAAGLALVLAGVGLTGARQNNSAGRHDRTPNPQIASSTTNAAAPVDGGRFALRIVDYDSGVPLEGAHVRFTLHYFGASPRTENVRTDKDGRAFISASPPELKRVEYEAENTNYLSLHGEWFDQELLLLDREYQIRLSHGVEIGGSVVDESGKPVSGAEVAFDQPMNMLLSAGHYRTDHAEMWAAPGGKKVAATDAEGRWKARCIWPDISWASLRVHHADFADVTCSTELTRAMEAVGQGVKVSFKDLQEGRVRLTLTKGVSVNGRVVSESGESLPGIEVAYAELLTSTHANDQLLGKQTVTTDAAGKFRLAHVPKKHLFFRIQTEGYAPAVAELDPKEPGADVELRLGKAQQLKGQLLESHGEPVPEARMEFADFGLWHDVHWETVTDDKGWFRWNAAPADKFQVKIRKDGFITQTKILQAKDSPVEVRVKRALHITGKVVDAATKQPIEKFKIDWLDRNNTNDFSQGYPYSTLAGTSGVYSLDLARLYGETWFEGYAHDCLFRVTANGYAPAFSRVFSSRKGDVGEVSYDVELKQTSQIFGTVVDADGRPVAGAQVALRTRTTDLFLRGKPRLEGPGDYQVTDDRGAFRLTTDPNVVEVVAAHERGFARVDTNEISTHMNIRLQPWGTIKGSVWKYDQAMTNEHVSVSAMVDNGTPWGRHTRFETNTDSHGEFSLPFMPPGKFAVFGMGLRETANIKGGETAVVKIGGSGRPVVGQFKIKNPYIPIEWRRNGDWYYFHMPPPTPPSQFKTAAEYEAWRDTPEVQRAFDNLHSYTVQCETNGSFHIDQVLPGKYELMVQLYDPRERDAMAYSKYIAKYNGKFEVPAGDANNREPMNLGVVEFSLTPEIVKGQTTAPEFEAMDMSDHAFRLADFRGKYVLLDFWATWCGPCIGEMPYLKQVHGKFKDRKDFAMISLSLDENIKEPREFLKKNDLPWIQGHLKESNRSVTQSYGVQGIPAIFLVNPDGKIVESDLRGGAMVAQLEKYLK